MNKDQQKILEQEYRKDKYKKVGLIAVIAIVFIAFCVLILMGKPS